jgi:superfamily II DNA or RNA helicase
LVQQAAASLRRFSLDVGVVMAGEPHRPTAAVQVVSIQTAVRRGMRFDSGLVVIDEAHHCTRSNTYAKFLDACASAHLLGLTATPFRLSGEGLGHTFGRIVVACYTDDLCAAGILVEPTVYAPEVPDLNGVRVNHGDYSIGELASRMNKPKLVGDIVQTWLRRAANRRTVVFATNVEHSQFIVRAFRAAGVRAEHLDGNTPAGLRDAILYRLRTGYTTVVSNCQVLGEGWDLPALEVAIIAKPTASLCCHLQQVGRVMRAADSKLGATVLDHAGNHLRHGPVTQRLEYSLADGASPQATTRQAAGKRCPGCYLIVDRSTQVCPECGHVWAGTTAVPEHAEGELVEYTAAQRRSAMSRDDQQAAWDRLEWRRRAGNYRPGWTFYQFKHHFGFTPTVIDGVIVTPETATQGQKSKALAELTATARERGYKPGWAAYQFHARFGHWPARRSA